MILHGRCYDTGQAVAVSIEDGRIAALLPTSERPVSWIAPTFFRPADQRLPRHQLQLAGRSRPEAVNRRRRVPAKHGIGGVLPDADHRRLRALRHGFATLAKAVEADAEPARRIARFHLEGPYLSGEDGPRGAHRRNTSATRTGTSSARWQDAAGGRIRMVTVAPERAGPLRSSRSSPARASWWRSATRRRPATNSRDAVTAGAKTSTHLGNGATRCCRGTRTTSGTNSPTTACGRASSRTGTTCRRRS